MQETQKMWVQSRAWEDLLEEEIATHSSILAWKIPVDRGAWRAIAHGVTKALDLTERKHTHTHTHTHTHFKDKNSETNCYALPLILSVWNLSLRIFFLMWAIFKVFIEFVTYCFCFTFWFFWQHGMSDLSSPTRNPICTPCIGRWSVNHWLSREVLKFISSRRNHHTV